MKKTELNAAHSMDGRAELAKRQRKKLFEYEGRYDDIPDEAVINLFRQAGGIKEVPQPQVKGGKASLKKASVIAKSVNKNGEDPDDENDIEHAIRLRKQKQRHSDFYM